MQEDMGGSRTLEPLQGFNQKSTDEDRPRGANHLPKTLRDVLVKCNYTWNPRIKAISDWHSGQSTNGKLGAEYETVTPKIKLN